VPKPVAPLVGDEHPQVLQVGEFGVQRQSRWPP
jgi:hypothetical protein